MGRSFFRLSFFVVGRSFPSSVVQSLGRSIDLFACLLVEQSFGTKKAQIKVDMNF